MRHLLFALLATVCVSSALAQNEPRQPVILAVGLSDVPAAQQPGSDLTPQGELAALNPIARIVPAQTLIDAKSKIADGEQVAAIVLFGDTVQKAIAGSLISGSPGERAGFAIAQALNTKTFSPNLSIYFWNCVGSCRIQSTSRFQADFRRTFLAVTNGNQPGLSITLMSRLNETSESNGRRTIRVLLSASDFVLGRLRAVTRLGGKVGRGIAFTVLEGVRYGIPINTALSSISYWPSPVGIAGLGLSLAFLAKLVAQDFFGFDLIPIHPIRYLREKYGKGAAPSCKAIVGS